MVSAGATSAWAADVSLGGLYSGKALLVIDGGRPQAIRVGETSPEGVKVVAIEGDSAYIEVSGQKQKLTVGQQAVSVGGDATASPMISLTADPAGHFRTVGTINGVPTRFLVDTGATLISLGKSDAIRANVDFEKGTPAMSMTANGPVRVWRVKLNSVRVGDVILNQVDASVHERDLPVALLGMSFLNRMEMKRDGTTMTLKKRF